MRFWKRRGPVDLVSSQIEELEVRNAELIEEQAHDSFTTTLFREDNLIRASGGWCAPGETIYELPEISVIRGGIRHPPRDKSWLEMERNG